MQKKPITAKKYEFTGRSQVENNGKLMREVMALRDRDLFLYRPGGGPILIESSKNISQIGTSPIVKCSDRAMIIGDHEDILAGKIQLSVPNMVSISGKMQPFQRHTLCPGIFRYCRS